MPDWRYQYDADTTPQSDRLKLEQWKKEGLEFCRY